MRLRIKVLLVAASAMAAMAGCEEPREIVPVAPPGFDLVRTPTNPGVEAQALGEQPAAALAQGAGQKQTPSIVANASPTPIGKSTATDDGLIYETLVEGTGPNAKSGDSVEVHYTGTLEDGTKFDSSVDRGKPFPVTLGMGSVIRGWDEGIPGMKVGEKRKLTIPAHLGYKDKGQGSIPPNAKLIFEVELMKINN
jgi:FKBP-type peptidyl-prolyl cis-trans isomerase